MAGSQAALEGGPDRRPVRVAEQEEDVDAVPEVNPRPPVFANLRRSPILRSLSYEGQAEL